jgi:S-adenosylmethionine synthetase
MAAVQRIEKLGGLTPHGNRTHLELNKPIYARTAAYARFGRTPKGDFLP